jgi:hypothetical protein
MVRAFAVIAERDPCDGALQHWHSDGNVEKR